jgi:hypothetical protein
LIESVSPISFGIGFLFFPKWNLALAVPATYLSFMVNDTHPVWGVLDFVRISDCADIVMFVANDTSHRSGVVGMIRIVTYWGLRLLSSHGLSSLSFRYESSKSSAIKALAQGASLEAIARSNLPRDYSKTLSKYLTAVEVWETQGNLF